MNDKFELRRQHKREFQKMMSKRCKTFKWGKDTFYADTSRRYANGGTVVQVIMDNGALWGILSVNIPGETEHLRPGEFFAKTWSENEGWSQAALDSGIFVDTGFRMRTGFVQAQLWKLA